MTGSISFGFGGSDLIVINTFDSLIDSNFFCLGSNVNVVVLKRIPGPKTRVLKIPKRARTTNHLKKMTGRIQFQANPRQPQSQGNLSTKGFINLIRVFKRYRINIDVKHHLCYFINKVKFRN